MRAHLWCVKLYNAMEPLRCYTTIIRSQHYTANPNSFYVVYLRHHNATTKNALNPTKTKCKNENLLQRDPKSASRISEDSPKETARKQL